MVLIQLILAFPFKINKLCFSLIWPPNVPAACRLVSPNILAKKLPAGASLAKSLEEIQRRYF